jgi:hypothetical protein
MLAEFIAGDTLAANVGQAFQPDIVDLGITALSAWKG